MGTRSTVRYSKDDELSVLFHEGITLETETEDRCKQALQYTFSEGIIQALAELHREPTSFKQWLVKRGGLLTIRWCPSAVS